MGRQHDIVGMLGPVQPSAPSGQYPLGFTAKGLAPGIPTKIVQKPQIGFRPDRFIVATKDAFVHSIQIAGEEQMVTGTPIPAAIFAPTALPAQLALKAAAPGQEIAIVVECPKGGDFSAVMLGAEVDLPPVREPLVDEAAKAIREDEERYEPGVTLEELLAHADHQG